VNQNLIDHFKAARLCSVPVLAISSPDQTATITSIAAALNGGKKGSPIYRWDCVSGISPINQAAEEKLGSLIDGAGSDMDPTIGDPVAAIRAFSDKARDRSVMFVVNSHRFLDNVVVVQIIANCRDVLKGDGRTLVLLGPVMRLPIEVAGDVVMFDEPLPNAEQLSAIVTQAHKDAERPPVEPDVVTKAVEAVQGLPAFQAEQATALALADRKSPLDLSQLWEHKRGQIEQTPALKVWRGGDKFDSIGGCDVIKGFIGRILKGHGRPNAIVFIDEIEKMFAGASGDTSGVSQDQMGTLLTYMQDQNACGMIMVGPPGSGKSAVAKAAGNEGGIPTVQLDLGASKGSLVGDSEKNIRNALKVITAVSNSKSLWIATSNRIADLPPELRRRFTLGTFFFDLPTKEERLLIWKIHTSRYCLDPKASGLYPDDTDWTGAEIRQCTDIAWRLGCTLKEAAEFVVPIAKSAGESIERLRQQAHGKYLSASQPGTYQKRTQAEPAKGGRRFHEN
jgi:hypothetical protein